MPLIFEIIRRKVRDVAGFEVVEELALSTFSFAKYLMWKDLVDRSDQLRHNPVSESPHRRVRGHIRGDGT